MILVHQKFLRYLLLFILIVLINVYLGIYIDSELLKINCFPYETAFENFRDEEIEEDVLNGFLYASENHPREKKGQTDIDNQSSKEAIYDVDIAKFSEYLAMYFALDHTCTDTELLDQNISFVKERQPEKFESIQSKIEAMWTDAVLFPVGTIENTPEATVDFTNSWRQSRTFGGDRFHEGCDIMASLNERGIYPVYSVSDGFVENIGWLRLGGYRIGIRSEHGVYFYYAHLSDYARDFAIGEEVKAGTLLGFMGDTGYSDIEGTTGNFPVHLHFGIYFNDESGNEFSVNPFPLLRYLNSTSFANYENCLGSE